MNNLNVCTKSNGKELKELIEKYNSLVNELNETILKISNFKLELEVTTYKAEKVEKYV